MDKCITIIKTGPRKGDICGSSGKVIDIVDRKEVSHCNRHRLKSKQKDNDVDLLTTNLNKSLKLSENKNVKEEIVEFIDSGEEKIINKLDKKLDDLFKEYGL